VRDVAGGFILRAAADDDPVVARGIEQRAFQPPINPNRMMKIIETSATPRIVISEVAVLSTTLRRL